MNAYTAEMLAAERRGDLAREADRVRLAAASRAAGRAVRIRTPEHPTSPIKRLVVLLRGMAT